MRWLLVGDGSSIHIRRLAAALAERGIETHLACFEGDSIDGVHLQQLGDRAARDDRRYLLAIPALARLIRSVDPDVVNAHYLSSYGLMAALTPFRGLLVQTTWGTDLLVTARSGWRRLAAAFALRRAGHATGDSRDLKYVATALAPGVRWHRFIFGPPASLFELDLPRENVIVSPRRLDPEMRVDLAVKGFRAAHLPGWRLVIAGGGSMTLVESDGVEVRGPLAQPELHRLMASGRLLVSVPTSDATSAALLEGLACGLLPIVNDLAANREWLTDETAIFVPRDPLAEDIAAAFMRAAGRQHDARTSRAVVAETTWEGQVDDLIEAVRGWLS